MPMRGSNPTVGVAVAQREVSIGDIYATVYKAMRIDWTKEYMTQVGRPVKIANSFEDKTGKPIPELLG